MSYPSATLPLSSLLHFFWALWRCCVELDRTQLESITCKLFSIHHSYMVRPLSFPSFGGDELNFAHILPLRPGFLFCLVQHGSVGHPNVDVLRVIIEALAMLLKAHPKQALWHLSSLCLSISNTRREVSPCDLEWYVLCMQRVYMPTTRTIYLDERAVYSCFYEVTSS